MPFELGHMGSPYGSETSGGRIARVRAPIHMGSIEPGARFDLWWRGAFIKRWERPNGSLLSFPGLAPARPRPLSVARFAG